MKTIAPAAMAAIEAGEAIVTGAVEITPISSLDYTPVTVVDVDSVTNGDGSLSNAMTVGITVSGLLTTDTLRLTLPAGELYTAWNYQYDGTANRWVNSFDVVPDAVPANSFRVSQAGIAPSSGAHFPDGYATAADAQAAFGSHLISGASEYTFWIMDTAPGGGSGTFNNFGGVSVSVEKQIVVAGGGTPLRLWGGFGPISFTTDTGLQEFQGVGNSAIVQQNAGAIGGVAQGMTIGLSGVEPSALELLDDAADFRGASVVVYRLIFDSAGKNLLDAHVFDRGRIDTIQSDETVGAAAAITAAVESAARSLGRSGARMRSDSDQRLISAIDGYFKNVAYAPQKKLYWGGKIPVATGSVDGAGPVAGTIGGTGAGF